MSSFLKKNAPHLLLFAAAVVWGIGFVFMKTATSVLPVFLLLAIRFTLAAVILAMVFLPHLLKINLSDVLAGCFIGFLIFISYIFQTYGLKDTTPGKNAFLTAVYCVLVPFLYWITDKKRPDKYNIVSAFLCIIGIGLVSLNGDFTIGTGDALTLCCGICFAFQILYTGKLCRKHDPMIITVFQFAFAGLLSWIMTFILEDSPDAIPTQTVWELAFLTVFSTALAFLCQNIGQKHSHPATASIILSLESVFGVLASILFGYEILSPRILVGFVVIFVSVIISETKLEFLHRKPKCK